MGLSTAAETLCSQVIHHVKIYNKIDTLLYRVMDLKTTRKLGMFFSKVNNWTIIDLILIIFSSGVMILLLVTLFIWCVWLNTESLFLLLQQPPCVAR